MCANAQTVAGLLAYYPQSLRVTLDPDAPGTFAGATAVRRAASETGGQQLRSTPDKFAWCGTDQASGRRSPPEQLVDMEDGHAVLEFTYRYLEAHSRPPSDAEVHSVTATIARVRGPQIVRWADLELILSGLFAMGRT